MSRLASGNCRGKTSDTKRQRRQRSKRKRLALFQIAHCRKVLQFYRCYRLIFGKPGSEAWNADRKSSTAFILSQRNCLYRIQSQALESSSGKRRVVNRQQLCIRHPSITSAGKIAGREPQIGGVNALVVFSNIERHLGQNLTPRYPKPHAVRPQQHPAPI